MEQGTGEQFFATVKRRTIFCSARLLDFNERIAVSAQFGSHGANDGARIEYVRFLRM